MFGGFTWMNPRSRSRPVRVTDVSENPSLVSNDTRTESVRRGFYPQIAQVDRNLQVSFCLRKTFRKQLKLLNQQLKPLDSKDPAGSRAVQRRNLLESQITNMCMFSAVQITVVWKRFAILKNQGEKHNG